jgi:outer membrane murein-binding lipoprotein Lpp
VLNPQKSLTVVLAVAVASLTAGLSGCSQTTATTDVSSPVDITNGVLTNLSGDCAEYSASYQANVLDIKRDMPFVSEINVSDDASHCSVAANAIPNYDFNDDTARFAEDVAAQNISLTIPRNPSLAGTPTEFSLLAYNAVMLNGVVLDQLANGCYKPDDAAADQDGNVADGCGLLVDWRLDPMGPVGFGTDSHNGHTQPGGLYHYHGNPNALFDPEETDQGSPVIGFAADGFPIYGPHYLDPATGEMREAVSGYTLRAGNRPTGDSSPGGTYDGTYIQDYEFTSSGTLDECNGMTINGQYGYYVTASYPYVMGCFAGTPDLSFFKFWDIARWVIGGIVTLLVMLAGLIVWLVLRRRQRHAHQSNKGITQ